jgi:hypothetical protein
MFIIWPVGIAFWVLSPFLRTQICLPALEAFSLDRGLTLDFGDMDSDVGAEHDASWGGG